MISLLERLMIWRQTEILSSVGNTAWRHPGKKPPQGNPFSVPFGIFSTSSSYSECQSCAKGGILALGKICLEGSVHCHSLGNAQHSAFCALSIQTASQHLWALIRCYTPWGTKTPGHWLEMDPHLRREAELSHLQSDFCRGLPPTRYSPLGTLDAECAKRISPPLPQNSVPLRTFLPLRKRPFCWLLGFESLRVRAGSYLWVIHSGMSPPSLSREQAPSLGLTACTLP